MTLLIALLLMFQLGYFDFTYDPTTSGVKLAGVILLWIGHVIFVASPK